MTERDGSTDGLGQRPPTPRWVKRTALVAAILVVLVVVVLIVGGGGHGPGRHAAGVGNPSTSLVAPVEPRP